MILHEFQGQINTLYCAVYDDGESLRALLLDCGCAADFEVVNSFLASNYGRRKFDVIIVATTHAHPDHFGSAFKWKELGFTVCGPRGINDWYEGPFGNAQHRIDIGLTRFVSESMNKSASIWEAVVEMMRPSPQFAFPRRLTLDVEVPLADALAPEVDLAARHPLHPMFVDWKAIAVPGHTSHMMALWHEPSSTLYAADTIVHLPGKHGGFQPPLALDFPRLHVASLERLAKLPVKRLLLAHGGSFNVDHFTTPTTGSTTSYPALMIGLIGATKALISSKQRPLRGFMGYLIQLVFLPTKFGREFRRVNR